MINRYRTMLLTVGMISSLSLVIMAFQWTTTLTRPIAYHEPPVVDVVYTVPRSVIEPAKPKAKPIPLKSVDVRFVESEKTPIGKENDAPEQNEIDAPYVAIQGLDVPFDDVDTTTFISSEIAPQPVDGFSAFYSILKDNMKYPRQAQSRNVEGRVFVQFVVAKDGSLTNMHVLKGIGSGCDEEAMRVLKLTKWNPGKQRGVPVKVRMTQPIIFKMTPYN